MKRNTVLSLGLIAAAALGLVLAAPVLAHGNNDGHGMMGGQNGWGMGRSNMMGGAGSFLSFDPDNDGRTTPGEVRAGFKIQLEKFDSDGSGTLSAQEFQELDGTENSWMMDRFQMFDTDGNGQLTEDEIGTFADQMY